LIVKHRVPIVITSVGAPGEVVSAVHSYGEFLFHDVISVRSIIILI
jgi:nitronate monooxygenase